MRNDIIILICGMCLVTFIPRVLPTLVIEKLKLTKKMEKFFSLIPYTAMTSLIFPGILRVDNEKIYIGIIGGVVTIILAWKKIPVAINVILTIFVVMAIYYFGGK